MAKGQKFNFILKIVRLFRIKDNENLLRLFSCWMVESLLYVLLSHFRPFFSFSPYKNLSKIWIWVEIHTDSTTQNRERGMKKKLTTIVITDKIAMNIISLTPFSRFLLTQLLNFFLKHRLVLRYPSL